LKPEKCKFEQKRIEYLGLIISEGSVAMDPVKIRGVLDWLAPMKVKEVQSFLGFVNFYRSFIKDFSKKACPLHALTRKAKAWAWGPDEDRAFHTLKEAVTSAPILTFPADSGHFKLECDASNFTTGAVLSQLQTDGEFHPVAFMSKSFTDVERNYEVYDKEMLAIIRALEEWWHFLQGAEEKVDVYTDHCNLGYFRTTQ